MKYVPDTSAIINGKITELLKDGTIKDKDEIIIAEFVLSELENQANRGKETGFIGLDEIKLIRSLGTKMKVKISELGRKPTAEEIRLASAGRIDALIRDIAKTENATLITADIVQAKTAEAQGVHVMFFEKEKIKTLQLEKYFDEKTMSVHLKEGAKPRAKKGSPGKFDLVEIGDEILTKDRLEEIAKEILEVERMGENAYIEIGKHKVTVIQLGPYRIAITRRPFSEKMEITAVRPIVKVSLEDYKLQKMLKDRLDSKAEGILIAGPPGHGKSTLAQALANYYEQKKKIVKTMENPRDLQLNPSITQYGPLEDDMAKTADILLLVRPDITIYDEVRKTSDFNVFADMRLAGVGMIGVVHATKPIDAIHRFLERVELGLLPHIVDTILFVFEGKIQKVYSLNLLVKVPTGMFEQDLARPLIEVHDFETGAIEYEIYTYGEQTAVIPISGKTTSKIHKLAEDKIKETVKKYAKNSEINVVSDDRVVVKLDDSDIGKFIGKDGKNVSALEEALGISISVEPKVETLKNEIPFELSEAGGYINIKVPEKFMGKYVDIYKGKDFLFNATIGKSGQIKVKKTSDIGNFVMQAYVLKNLRVLI